MKTKLTHLLAFGAILMICPINSFNQTVHLQVSGRRGMHHEVPDQKYLAPQSVAPKPGAVNRFEGPGFFTTQVNVNPAGGNIPDDAANEPSIAVDPTNPNNIAIGWRQFDNVNSNFRQAGYGFSSDGGQTWTFPGVLEPSVFRSDPVLDFDASGHFYYNSLTNVTGAFTCRVFKSTDGGALWDAGTDAHGGDKQWMAIDRSGGEGNGNIYSCWNSSYSSCMPGFFTRSADANASYENCVTVDGDPFWGTMEVGPDGGIYIAGAGSVDGMVVVKSSNAQVPGSTINWDFTASADLDGSISGWTPINPEGLLGQVNIGIDRSDGPGRGNVYVAASVERWLIPDPADVMFARSTDGGMTFGTPKRINTDAGNGNYQWFGTMSVAPDGRIDVVWLDTRDASPGSFLSALYYCYSADQGETWSINKRLSESFDPSVGYPQQDKMGDYFDMVSDDAGAHLAWTNTLNGEEDVYYTHIIPTIVGMNEVPQSSKSPAFSCSPNPFRDGTSFKYTLRDACFVKVEICNLYGAVIRTVVEKQQPAGTCSVNFNGEQLPAGFYLCRLSAGNQTETVGLVKLK